MTTVSNKPDLQLRMQVMICTFGRDGLDSVARMRLPAVSGVGYLVSCQSAECQLPAALVRDDVEVHFVSSRGLSNNRNAALDMVTASYAVIADDDLDYDADALKALIQIFEAHPHADILTFRCRFSEPHVYPASQISLPAKVRGYEPTSVEIALRVDSVRRAGLRFNPLLGVGAPRYGCGEESVFLLAAWRAGLRGLFVPLTVCSHEGLTTCFRVPMPAGVIEGQGLYIGVRYGLTMPLRLLLKAWRTPGPRLRTLRHLVSGACYGLMYRRQILSPSRDGGNPCS